MARFGFGIKRLNQDSASPVNAQNNLQNPISDQKNAQLNSASQQPGMQNTKMNLNPQINQNPQNNQQQTGPNFLSKNNNSGPNQSRTSGQFNPAQSAQIQSQVNPAQGVMSNSILGPQKTIGALNRPLMKEDVAKKAAEIHQIAMEKQQKMKFMKSFIELKRKIYQLIELGKPEDARDTYDNLFLLYQEMSRNVKPEDILSIKTDISVVYHNLEQALNKKKIKKGVFKEFDNNKKDAEKLYRDKIVTTDLDSIMQIVEEKGKMNLAEIETKFNITRRLAEEWIQILADYGLVEIKYLPIGGIEISKISK